jgi:neutral ceramidase
MAGRRLREAMAEIVLATTGETVLVTIAGLSNTYTHYITTYEEYQGQRYEAASTLYGPHTLDAYIQEFSRILYDLLDGEESESAGFPPDLMDVQIELIPPVVVDRIAKGKEYGEVYEETFSAASLQHPGSVVSSTFYSANPRNDQKLGGSFLFVEMQGGSEEKNDDGDGWKVAYVYADWCTKYIWSGGVGHEGESFSTVEFDIPSDVDEGVYRLCHEGTRKHLGGRKSEFRGCGSEFTVMKEEGKKQQEEKKM